ncbi:hypothetical protein AS189_17615 [Arthrobacter alpinus]|uniref:Uncharacterized protein n=1 Tax=Arthrobacter alpinus TaxID=656366 RepID=A0A0S2M2H6_9MICC|nr:hypothetical protein [Arthrobacter alpinus]ALO67971.1 hypothetical protein AS189_17615 [Arthrobacter alpinus]
MTGVGNESGPGVHRLGAERTEAGPYTPGQLARWSKQDAFRMEYGVLALLTGWFVTFVVFCLGLTVASVGAGGSDGFGWGFLFLALMFGFPVAAIIGLPLAIAIASPLRRVHNQWLHVPVFALAVGAAMGVVVAFPYDLQEKDVWLLLAPVLWAAASAAIGRASVIKMVARRN